MKSLIRIKCSNCGAMFKIGNTNGMPNGMSFILQDDKEITMCQKCLIEVGKMSNTEKDEFFKKLRGE